MATARLLGYWAVDNGRRLPEPWQFVDTTWSSTERHTVIDHLERATLVNQYRGLSSCRCCGRENGSAELTDGRYCWPEGLAHYVAEHDVRLPDEFVAHVRSSATPHLGKPRPRFDARGQRDRYWPETSPWRSSEPFDHEWWIDMVRSFLERGGTVQLTAALPRPCTFCGEPSAPDGSDDRVHCCLEALARHLQTSTGSGGAEFESYRHGVLLAVAPPRIDRIGVDISWWLDQASGGRASWNDPMQR